jgi:hypothetical protein
MPESQQESAMPSEASDKRKSATSRGSRAAANKRAEDPFAMIGSVLPAGSPERAAVGIVGATAGVLLLAAKFGAGPTALAVAAGYLTYLAASGNKESQRAGLELIDSVLRGRR